MKPARTFGNPVDGNGRLFFGVTSNFVMNKINMTTQSQKDKENSKNSFPNCSDLEEIKLKDAHTTASRELTQPIQSSLLTEKSVSEHSSTSLKKEKIKTLASTVPENALPIEIDETVKVKLLELFEYEKKINCALYTFLTDTDSRECKMRQNLINCAIFFK